MGQRISGSGVGLQAPAYLYPSELNPSNAPLDLGNAYTTLGPGQALPIPAGSYYVGVGKYSMLQFKDPVTTAWRSLLSGREQVLPVISDGFNYRIANLTGCPVAAIVTTGGSGYVQATTTVTPNAGNSTWQAVVGGMLSVSIGSAGSGYGVAPLLFIAAPPSPGVAATGYCVIQSGTVASVVLNNVGAGYVTAPTAVVVTHPTDPNYIAGSTITPAEVTLAVVGSGSVAAVICTNPGVSVGSAPTLAFAGAGSSAAATALRMATFVSATVSSAGAWTGGAAMGTLGGGAPATNQYANPAIQGQDFIPRPASALLGPTTTITSVVTVWDAGLFLADPLITVGPVSGNFAPATSIATVTATYGGLPDTVLLQPAP